MVNDDFAFLFPEVDNYWLLDVVRHERIGEHGDLIGTRHFPQMVHEYFEVARRGEGELLVITPRHHVHCSSRGIEPRRTGHGDLEDVPQRLIRIYPHRLPLSKDLPPQMSKSSS